MRQLEIMWNNVDAGTLTELLPGKGYRFKYAPSYLNGSYPHISVTLPKTDIPYESESLFPFFANMLPEGALLGAARAKGTGGRTAGPVLLGLPAATVGTRLARGRTLLQQELQED